VDYIWLSVNDMQALLRQIKQGSKTNKEGLPIHSLREAMAVLGEKQAIRGSVEPSEGKGGESAMAIPKLSMW
jgi:hypothetical protein